MSLSPVYGRCCKSVTSCQLILVLPSNHLLIRQAFTNQNMQKLGAWKELFASEFG